MYSTRVLISKILYMLDGALISNTVNKKLKGIVTPKRKSELANLKF